MSKYGYAHGRVSHMQKSSAMKVTEESLRNIYLAYHPVSNELGGVEVNRWEGKKTHLQGRGWLTKSHGINDRQGQRLRPS